MNLLVIVLNEVNYLDDILEGFVEIGVKGATILDSQGMGAAITSSGKGKDLFLSGIRSMLENAKPYNKTIFAVIKDKDILQKAVELVENIAGDMSKPGIGFMFTIPQVEVLGKYSARN